MTKSEPHDVAQADDQTDESRLNQLTGDVSYRDYAVLAAAAVLGLLVNAWVMAQITGTGFGGIIDGVTFLGPATIFAGWIYHRYEPVSSPVASVLVLGLTIVLANGASLMVKVFRGPTTLGADPVFGIIAVLAVAAIFSPGPFFGVWAARKWFVESGRGDGVGGA